jgi:Flp pilus assembly protein TadG
VVLAKDREGGSIKVKSQNGGAAVEFAIVLPILVLLVFAIIEFSVALYDKAMITNASREGARAGIVFSDPRISDNEITSVVNNYCGSYLITFGAATGVTTTIQRGGNNPGDSLTVRVAYQYTFLVLPAFVTDLIGGINMAAETVMRME